MKLNESLKKLAQRHAEIEVRRRKLQELSQAAQKMSKQAIFALQRDEKLRAAELLRQAQAALLEGRKIVLGEKRLYSEGMWRAALEEFCEAFFFERYIAGKELLPVPVTDEPDILVGGLSDLIGEFVRLAVKRAIDRDKKSVDKLLEMSNELIEFMLALDATGALRNKIDQARQHQRRLEDIRYDLSLV
jgi:predicted translin family RNA/ssDNA-binding protein